MTMVEHVLVVGGSRGLGRVFADMARGLGTRVSVVARSAPLQEGHYQADGRNAEEVEPLLARIVSERGPLTGMIFSQRFRGDKDDWEGEMATSLRTPKTFIERGVSFFDPERPGSIVLVSSVAAVLIWDAQPCAYHVAKAGICQLARYYAVALGPRNIRVNAVCPATFLKPENESYYREHPEVSARLARASPLHRMGTAQEVANVILFLLSDRASFITGQALIVDGGVSLQAQEPLVS